MTVFFATTPSYGHPSGLPPAPPEGEGRKEEGTTLGVAPLLSEGSGEAPPLPFREGSGEAPLTYSSP